MCVEPTVADAYAWRALFEQEQSCNKQDGKTESIEPLGKKGHSHLLCVCVSRKWEGMLVFKII